ncbi:MAG: alpha/beta hydrolase [Actinomycetia bacterium]|nr:alpha/beta hydrolase [Actinomycetes bacterium]
MSQHPGVKLLREMLADSGLTGGTILERRAAMDASAANSPAPEGTTVTTGELGGRPTEWVAPVGLGDDAPTVLHLHGGGYCMGGHDTHRGFAGRLAIAAQARVAVPDYRLAPEHPFPAALDDALAATSELLSMRPGPEHTALTGDSAGGGLAVATLMALRDAGGPVPAAAALISPWADLTQSADSHDRLDGLDPLLVREDLDQMADAYLAGCDPRDPRVSPVFADDLAGLPPLCIEVGDQEVLLDDSTALAALARRSRIDVSLTVWPELTHDFQIFPPEVVPESDASIEAMARFIWKHIGD